MFRSVRFPVLTMRTILVCGGRDYTDAAKVAEVLSTVLARAGWPMRLLHGDATGADALAKAWAEANQVEAVPFPVLLNEWRCYGKGAGPIRNARMVAQRPDLVVAFPGGAGTADCVRQAREAGIPVLTVQTPGRPPK